MAVNWSNLQAQQVEEVLAAYPAASNRCEICASKVRRIGVEVDRDASVSAFDLPVVSDSWCR